TTLPDVPVGASGDSAASDQGQQPRLDSAEPKSRGGDHPEIKTVSYTEILSSWTPEQAASSERAGMSDGPATRGGSSGEATDQDLIDGSIDEFKTNVMHPVELTDPHNARRNSFQRGSLPVSRPISLFGEGVVPWGGLGAPDPAVGQDPATASGEARNSNDNLVVTAHGFADVRTQPVEAFDPT